MTLALSMPGGSEWLILLPVLFIFLVSPVLAIIYYSQTKRLRRELEKANTEKRELLNKILNKTGDS